MAQAGVIITPGIGPLRRKRVALLCLLATLFVLAALIGRHDYLQLDLDDYYRATDTAETTLWASTEPFIQQSFLPKPHSQYRFTFLHALVRTVSDTYRTPIFPVDVAQTEDYVHILAFIEETPLPFRQYIEWQTSIPPDLSFIEKIECRFQVNGTNAVSAALHKTTKPHHYPPIPNQITYMLFCPIPLVVKEKMQLVSPIRGDVQSVVTLNISFQLTENVHLDHSISLHAHSVESEPTGIQTKATICLAPIHHWSEESALASLEWREHHRQMGIDSVHWYARDMDLQDHVAQINKHLGVKDTFRYAPYLSPETHQTGILQGDGESADQSWSIQSSTWS